MWIKCLLLYLRVSSVCRFFVSIVHTRSGRVKFRGREKWGRKDGGVLSGCLYLQYRWVVLRLQKFHCLCCRKDWTVPPQGTYPLGYRYHSPQTGNLRDTRTNRHGQVVIGRLGHTPGTVETGGSRVLQPTLVVQGVEVPVCHPYRYGFLNPFVRVSGRVF